MTSNALQEILLALFGEAAGSIEIVAQTDSGPVWAFPLKGDFQHARGNWERLREALVGVNLWPLQCGYEGREEDVRSLARCYEASCEYHPYDPLSKLSSTDLLRAGLDLDVHEWLRLQDERAAHWRAEQQAWLESRGYASQQESIAAQAAIESRNEAIIAEMCAAGEADEDGWVSFIDETGACVDALCGERGDNSAEDYEAEEPAPHPPQMWRPPASIWFVLVPARHGWEVPAMLRYGNWNGCPAPQVHIALMRHWDQEYGAQLFSLTHDTLSFAVARPPQSREEAMLLARQHSYYCSEGMEEYTLERLADELVGQSRWGFWWD